MTTFQPRSWHPGHESPRRQWTARVLLLAFLALALASTTAAAAQPTSCDTTSSGAEGVEDFASDLIVNPDASLSVRETIRVLARGQQLTSDIFRDFPSHYQDARGHVYAPIVSAVDVKRDGSTVSFVTRHLPGGTRVYLGIPDAPLPPGEYTYTLTYRVVGALGFFADGDQVYWPTTPPNWTVPIACATATVSVPPGAPVIGIQAGGWIGPADSPFAVIQPTIDRSGVITYVAPGPLAYDHELTVSVTWPRGYVQEPVSVGQTWPLIGSGDTARIESIGLGLLVLVSIPALVWVRRRPRLPAPAPSARPPDQLSPAAARFLATATFDEATLAATILDLAVKGFLFIREITESHGETGASARESGRPVTMEPGPRRRIELVKVEGRAGGPRLAPEEGAALAELLGSKTTCRLGGESFRELRRASDELKRLVGALYEDRYFTHSARYQIPALAIATAMLAAAALSETNRASLDVRTGVIWFVVAGSLVFGTAFFLGAALLATQFRTLRQAVGFVVVAMAAYLVPLIVLYYVQTQIAATSLGVVVLLAVTGVALALLRKLLATTTRDGHRSRARLDDFRDFLVTTGPDSTDDSDSRWNGAWEAFLPYAIALDVDHRWAWPSIRPNGEVTGRGGVTWYRPTESELNDGGPAASLGDVLVTDIREGLRGPTTKAGDIIREARSPRANGRP